MSQEVTFSMFSHPESRVTQPGLAFSPPAPEELALTEKYRPARFSGIVGQDAALKKLATFVARPCPKAFLFLGETGTGKTTAGLALANELGVCPHWGLHKISAGEMDGDAVALALKQLRYVAPGDRWKMVLCDEADSMSAKARQMWLSALESISPKSVIVFTSNHAARFERRFVDRCQVVKFASDATALMPPAQALLDSLWAAENMPGSPPDVRLLPDLVDKKALSFRRVVRVVEDARAMGHARYRLPG